MPMGEQFSIPKKEIPEVITSEVRLEPLSQGKATPEKEIPEEEKIAGEKEKLEANKIAVEGESKCEVCGKKFGFWTPRCEKPPIATMIICEECAKRDYSGELGSFLKKEVEELQKDGAAKDGAASLAALGLGFLIGGPLGLGVALGTPAGILGAEKEQRENLNIVLTYRHAREKGVMARVELSDLMKMESAFNTTIYLIEKIKGQWENLKDKGVISPNFYETKGHKYNGVISQLRGDKEEISSHITFLGGLQKNLEKMTTARETLKDYYDQGRIPQEEYNNQIKKINNDINGIKKIELENANLHGVIEKPKAEQKSGCFIATAVYGDSEASQIETLRSFRDNYLKNIAVGKLLLNDVL